MSKKPKLNKYHYQQMLDRIDTISNVVDNNLQQHPVAKIHTDIKDHIAKANDELFKASLLTKTIYNKMAKDPYVSWLQGGIIRISSSGYRMNCLMRTGLSSIYPCLPWLETPSDVNLVKFCGLNAIHAKHA